MDSSGQVYFLTEHNPEDEGRYLKALEEEKKRLADEIMHTRTPEDRMKRQRELLKDLQKSLATGEPPTPPDWDEALAVWEDDGGAGSSE